MVGWKFFLRRAPPSPHQFENSHLQVRSMSIFHSHFQSFDKLITNLEIDVRSLQINTLYKSYISELFNDKLKKCLELAI